MLNVDSTGEDDANIQKHNMWTKANIGPFCHISDFLQHEGSKKFVKLVTIIMEAEQNNVWWHENKKRIVNQKKQQKNTLLYVWDAQYEASH